MNKQYQLGIIGAGKIVENNHLPVLKKMNGIEVKWIYDIDEKRAKLLSSMYDLPLISTWESAIKDIDICLITAPYGVRKPYLSAAANFNKCVYIEKPFALTVNEHIEMSSMFKKYEIAIGFQRRCYKLANQLKQIVDSKIFGSIKNIDFKQGSFSLKGGSSYLSDVNLAGGGIIIESAIHSFDLILNFSGATEVEVAYVKYIERAGIDYESTVASTLTTPYGKIPVTCQTSTLRNLINGLTISFENATLKCKLSPDANIHVCPLSNPSGSFVIESNPDNNIVSATTVSMSFFIFWKKFIESLDEKTENITSAVTSVLTTMWMQKIYARIGN